MRREDGQVALWQATVLFSDDAAQFAAMQRLTQRHAELTKQRSLLQDQQQAASSTAEQAAAGLRNAEKAAERLQRLVCVCALQGYHLGVLRCLRIVAGTSITL